MGVCVVPHRPLSARLHSNAEDNCFLPPAAAPPPCPLVAAARRCESHLDLTLFTALSPPRVPPLLHLNVCDCYPLPLYHWPSPPPQAFGPGDEGPEPLDSLLSSLGLGTEGPSVAPLDPSQYMMWMPEWAAASGVDTVSYHSSRVEGEGDGDYIPAPRSYQVCGCVWLCVVVCVCFPGLA